jgi:WD40 repeat protein
VAFSPDGQTVLIGSGNSEDPENQTGELQLWDVQTRLSRGESIMHGHVVSAVAFSPDGQTNLMGSNDKAARLWPVPAPAIYDRAHPDRLRLSVEVRTGKRLEAYGVVERLKHDDWIAKLLELDRQGGPCDRPTWDEYNAWLKSQPRRSSASRR